MKAVTLTIQMSSSCRSPLPFNPHIYGLPLKCSVSCTRSVHPAVYAAIQVRIILLLGLLLKSQQVNRSSNIFGKDFLDRFSLARCFLVSGNLYGPVQY